MSKLTKEFSLEVRKIPGQTYGLTLIGRPQYRNGTKDVSVTVYGRSLQSVLDHVLGALKRSGYNPAELSARRRKPFTLTEEDGVRLGLLFLAVKPLRKTGRIEAVSETLRGMQPEEAFYWFSKCSTGSDARRARRAFRLLAAEE